MSASTVTVTAYTAVLLAAVAAALVSWRRPTVVAGLGAVLTWAMRRRSTQLFVLLAWWWLGWHFVTSR